jgi:hypothetical protein
VRSKGLQGDGPSVRRRRLPLRACWYDRATAWLFLPCGPRLACSGARRSATRVRAAASGLQRPDRHVTLRFRARCRRRGFRRSRGGAAAADATVPCLRRAQSLARTQVCLTARETPAALVALVEALRRARGRDFRPNSASSGAPHLARNVLRRPRIEEFSSCAGRPVSSPDESSRPRRIR